MSQKENLEMNDKREAGEIVISNPFLKWLDNIWYHYKWGLIIGGFFLLVFLVCFVQCSTKQDSDLSVTFAGGYTLTEGEVQGIKEVLSSVAKKADNGEEATLVGLLSYPIYTENELRAKYTGENGEFSDYPYRAAVSANTERLNTLQNYLLTGECSIWLVSEFVYEEKNVGKKLGVPLADTFGEALPAGAYDTYAVRLGDTALYQYYSALQVLPEDTLIVLTQSFVVGASSNEAHYALCVDLYRALLEFEAPQ